MFIIFKKLTLTSLLFILTVLLVLLGLSFSFIWFPKKEIYLAIAGVGGSLAGGWITLIGVKLTIQKSDEDRFIQTFMDKILAIKNSIDFLQEFRDEDCANYEGEELWSIILFKSDKFELIFKNINEIIGGETAYSIYERTESLSRSSTSEFEEYLNFHPRVRIFGRHTILNPHIIKIIESIDVIIDKLEDEEERLLSEYNRIKKKRFII
ncbi:hypothetical protein [Paenibacillus lautus]|uniref:hypothetical protein n=1 Tax=Paenibacillus lautus TaxID=1401 RepID=UPI003D289DD4